MALHQQLHGASACSDLHCRQMNDVAEAGTSAGGSGAMYDELLLA
ncbi:hypothetical protein WSK_0576 [Novosphingobium sp. Rr 2-17]|nr:hypothetical protein WSK_0576 [Novosphingobium sp. Rr 2-17]